eukprot:TRINITY_DN8852_c0_g1_i5.p1 TRINITY_DN8852_c0_g1~~TRINITY_DN8852_c0_g1_i5.p1  ORF type:complete len:272 (+),score=59.00 TRINITY_DN8852_c0_g1_i5:165-980(+)
MKRLQSSDLPLKPSQTEWNFFEDQVLRELVQKSTSKKWKVISQKMSEDVESKQYTPEECKRRWNYLQHKRSAEASWTDSEELLLMLRLWHTKSIKQLAMSTKNSLQIRKRLCDNLRQAATYKKPAKETPLEKLKILFYSLIILGCQRRTNGFCEIDDVVLKLEVKENEVLEFVGKVSEGQRVGRVWTREILESYVSDAIERLQNNLLTIKESDYLIKEDEDSFNELLHHRRESRNMLELDINVGDNAENNAGLDNNAAFIPFFSILRQEEE